MRIDLRSPHQRLLEIAERLEAPRSRHELERIGVKILTSERNTPDHSDLHIAFLRELAREVRAIEREMRS
jgi:hypothetical protein